MVPFHAPGSLSWVSLTPYTACPRGKYGCHFTVYFNRGRLTIQWSPLSCQETNRNLCGSKGEEEWTARVLIDILQDPDVIGLSPSSTGLVGSEPRSNGDLYPTGSNDIESPSVKGVPYFGSRPTKDPERGRLVYPVRVSSEAEGTHRKTRTHRRLVALRTECYLGSETPGRDG